MTWVATGGSQFIKLINVLDRATIFADKGKAFKQWGSKIDTNRFSMNGIIEKTDLPDGSDMADFLLKDY